MERRLLHSSPHSCRSLRPANCLSGCHPFATNAHLLLTLLSEIVSETPCLQTQDVEWLFVTANTDLRGSGSTHFGVRKEKRLNVMLQIEDNLIDARGFKLDGRLEIRQNGQFIRPFDGRVWPSFSDSQATYVCRLQSAWLYENSDLIVEYNLVNVENMQLSGYFAELLPRIVYVPAINLPFAPAARISGRARITGSLLHAMRPIGVLATFVNGTFNEGSNRAWVLSRLRSAGISVEVVSGHASVVPDGSWRASPELRDLLDKTQILIDVRKNQGNQGVNEYRILPALLRGVVVVAERTALVEKLPYFGSVVFASVAEMAATVSRIQSTYFQTWMRIFGPGSSLNETLRRMRERARSDLHTFLICDHAPTTASCRANLSATDRCRRRKAPLLAKEALQLAINNQTSRTASRVSSSLEVS